MGVMWQWLIFLSGGFIAGLVNSVAGGGSFILFPLLLSNGLSAIVANATCTIIVMPGAFTSAYGYRKQLRSLPRRYFLLTIPSVLGGLVGAVILSKTPNKLFGHIVPFFILFAVVLLLLQPKIHRWLTSRDGKIFERKYQRATPLFLAALFVLTATYGGYFGAGFGLMTLGILGLTKIKSIHQMNGLKNLASISFGTTSVIYFIMKHLIGWHVLPWLLIGSALGGYLGATYSTKLPTKLIRALIIAIGVIISALLFRRYY